MIEGPRGLLGELRAVSERLRSGQDNRPPGGDEEIRASGSGKPGPSIRVVRIVPSLRGFGRVRVAAPAARRRSHGGAAGRAARGGGGRSLDGAAPGSVLRPVGKNAVRRNPGRAGFNHPYLNLPAPRSPEGADSRPFRPSGRGRSAAGGTGRPTAPTGPTGEAAATGDSSIARTAQAITSSAPAPSALGISEPRSECRPLLRKLDLNLSPLRVIPCP